MASTGEGPSPNDKPVRKVQPSPAMDPELATSRRNNCMKDHPETSETQNCGGGNLKEPRWSIATMSPGEMEAYAVLLIAGNVIWVVYEVLRATGSPVDMLHSIVTNLWQASAAALFITLTAAGISKGLRLAARRLRQWLFKSREG